MATPIMTLLPDWVNLSFTIFYLMSKIKSDRFEYKIINKITIK